MSAPQDFLNRFDAYMDAANKSFILDDSERQKQSVFLDFLQQAFGIVSSDIQRETSAKIKRAEVVKRGYIDALFGDVVFEFKRDLSDQNNLSAWREQLREYLVSKHNQTGQNYIGILTDTLRFEVYQLKNNELLSETSFVLDKANPNLAFVQLDTYLFSQKQLVPTAIDIVSRFGSDSPTFKLIFQELTSA